MKALILVDVQNDFLPGGQLPVPGGDTIIPILNALIPRYPLVAATQVAYTARDAVASGFRSIILRDGPRALLSEAFDQAAVELKQLDITIASSEQALARCNDERHMRQQQGRLRDAGLDSCLNGTPRTIRAPGFATRAISRSALPGLRRCASTCSHTTMSNEDVS